MVVKTLLSYEINLIHRDHGEQSLLLFYTRYLKYTNAYLVYSLHGLKETKNYVIQSVKSIVW